MKVAIFFALLVACSAAPAAKKSNRQSSKSNSQGSNTGSDTNNNLGRESRTISNTYQFPFYPSGSYVVHNAVPQTYNHPSYVVPQTYSSSSFIVPQTYAVPQTYSAPVAKVPENYAVVPQTYSVVDQVNYVQPGYVAKTPGVTHVAPLPVGLAFASHHMNLQKAPGTK